MSEDGRMDRGNCPAYHAMGCGHVEQFDTPDSIMPWIRYFGSRCRPCAASAGATYTRHMADLKARYLENHPCDAEAVP